MIVMNSIELVDDNGLGKKDFQCKAADKNLLPTDVAGGSSCLVLDTSSVLIFSEVDQAWIEL